MAAPTLAAGSMDPDLPLDLTTGKVYHLDCTGAELADKFLLVGDPGRVAVVAARFDAGSVRFSNSHREIVIMTGTYKGVPVTALSTGMGTDNIEIVVNEIHAVKEFDIASRKWQGEAGGPPRTAVGKIHLVRVGTCGCPRPDVPVGTLAITRHAIGMDNTCRYYQAPPCNAEPGVQALSRAANATSLGAVGVYATRAHPDATAAVVAAASKFAPSRNAIVGTTASGSGFYGCQGRAVGQFRGKLTVPNLVDELGSIEFATAGDDGTAATTEKVVNIEMENSAICWLSGMLGYKAGTVCAVVARRAGALREFASPDEAKAAIADAITVGLEALISIQ